MEGSSNPASESSPRFSVRYLGSMSMDRLYPQSMQPLVMAEVRRRKDVQDVCLEIIGESLRMFADTNTPPVGGEQPQPEQPPQPILEHHLSGLTRFAKLHQDPMCFAYLTRYQLSADFECHVFMAGSEEIIPQLFKAIREASKDLHGKPPSTQPQAPATTSATPPSQSTTTTTHPCDGASPSAGSMAEAAEVVGVDQSSSLFEVKYLGRIKVANKRVAAEYIDQIGEKMIAKEEDLVTKKQELRKELTKTKKRHPSDTSVKSLPDDLNDGTVKLAENSLVEQKETLNKGLRLSLFKRGSLHDNDNDSSLDDGSSNDGSSDNITGLGAVSREGGGLPPLHVDFRSDSDGSREKLDERDSSPSSILSSSVRRRHVSALDAKRSESPLVSMKKTSLDDSMLLNDKMASRKEDSSQVSHLPFLDQNRTMLLQISDHDISLVSLDKKLATMERNFKDISYVSQGSHKQDIFGIVARDASSSFMCYILQCVTDNVVAEIMATLQMSFSAAYKKQGSTTAGHTTSSAGSAAMTSPGPGLLSSPPASSSSAASAAAAAAQHQVCAMCPMHQLHRLCQEIHSLSPQAAHDLLVKKIHNLPEVELNNIKHQMQTESPESFEESVEMMMICLRRMCEYKQREHAHLSAGNKNAKSEINLLEEKHNIFEGLRIKARKSLTTSFENLIHRGRSKKEEAKDSFRQRSWTVDSEAGWVSRDSLSATSTPDASPMPSPSPMSRDVHHEFPSPPSSPSATMRKRSFTLGTIADSPRSWGGTTTAITSTSSCGGTPVVVPPSSTFHSHSSDSVAGESSSRRRKADVNHNKAGATATTVISPIKTMYLLSSHSQDSSLVSSSSSPSGVQSPAEDPHQPLLPLGGLAPLPGGRRQSLSWRKAIFERVCTPQHAAHHEENEEGVSSDALPGSGTATTPSHTEVRALWKKVILETLLLIRMEKENHNIRARQEEADSTISRKLDYQELTPCLKEITSIWENMLGFHEEERDREDRHPSSQSQPHPPRTQQHHDKEEKENSVTKDREEEEREEGEADDDAVDAMTDEEGERSREQRLIPHNTLLDCISKGVPRNLRGQIWLFLMQQRQMGSTVPDSVCDSVHYDDLLKQLTTHQHAILIDLGRTFPGHPYFSKALGPGQLELFNLLKAYSLLDTEVGYCQGISFIVGMLLMHMEEISAFHVLKFLMYDLGLRKQFRPNMVALQMKLYQLTRLLHDHYKDMYDHFETHDISPTLYAAPWFLTLFASQFPLGFVARVFDMLFVQGIEALFKVALVLLGSHRALILQCDSFESVVGFLKTTLPEMVQVQMERIINQAFELDITKELQAYEIEYHVLREEMSSPAHMMMVKQTTMSHARLSTSSSLSEDKLMSSSSAPWHRFGDRRRSSVDLEMVYRLEHHNRCLKQQNMDLLEKLQYAQSQIRSNEQSIHAHQLSEEKLKSQLRTLELERSALLAAVAKLRKLVPREALLGLNLSPSTLQAMSPTSPTAGVPPSPISQCANSSSPLSLSSSSSTPSSSSLANQIGGDPPAPAHHHHSVATCLDFNNSDNNKASDGKVGNNHHHHHHHHHHQHLLLTQTVSDGDDPLNACPRLPPPSSMDDSSLSENDTRTNSTSTTVHAITNLHLPPPPAASHPSRSVPPPSTQSSSSSHVPMSKPDADQLCQQADPFS